MLDLDSKNAHTLCSRDKLEEELELDLTYHYMLMSLCALYVQTTTVQCHLGNGPDRPATSFQLSYEGLRHGDAPATIYLNVLAKRFSRK